MLNELDTSDDCSLASFGFCPASNDYVILYVASDAPRDAFQFSVNNRSWSRLSNDLREAFKFFYTPGYYFEGSFYWIDRMDTGMDVGMDDERDDDSFGLISYSLDNQQLSFLGLGATLHDNPRLFAIRSLGDSLLVFTSDNRNLGIEIWELLNSEWRLLIEYDILRIGTPIACYSATQFLVSHLRSFDLLEYTPSAHITSRVLPTTIQVPQPAIAYIETLLTVPDISSAEETTSTSSDSLETTSSDTEVNPSPLKKTRLI
ncbi:uncharacterized protein LOC141600637 [Silene latifolia]|uniref:uncharacterized protein LOC141600637 n=1 Tax=Silene latifolia TaxID=37657 RepID=UPI003D7743BB